MRASEGGIDWFRSRLSTRIGHLKTEKRMIEFRAYKQVNLDTQS